MFVTLRWLSLTPLLLSPPLPVARVIGAVSSPVAVASPTANPCVTPGHFPLTDELLTRYIALKQDLQEYWRTHQAQLATANAHVHHVQVIGRAGGVVGVDTIKVFDNVALTAQDPTLAALFTKHHVLPQQFEPTEAAVYAVLLTMIASNQTGTPLSATNVTQKNALLVHSRRQALAAVGVHEEGPQEDDT